MWRTSAYIDINAWKAGIAERPEGYRWCSFAAAAQGDRKTRAGYAFMYGGGEWRVIRECHEQSMQEAMGEVLKTREAEKEECRAGRGASLKDLGGKCFGFTALDKSNIPDILAKI